MKLFSTRAGLSLFLASLALNLFLLAWFAGGMTGSVAVDHILKKRLSLVTATLPSARQDELARELELAMVDIQPQRVAIRDAQQRWLNAFERPDVSIAELNAHLQSIRQQREHANAVFHQHAMLVVGRLSASERQSIATQVRRFYEVTAIDEMSLPSSPMSTKVAP
jgi:hypothetical protein